jgi:hypothetical protein
VTFGEAIRPRSPHERDEVMERLQAFFAGREPGPSRAPSPAIAPDLAFPYASAMPPPAALDERRPQL